jgi:hypothetical protein
MNQLDDCPPAVSARCPLDVAVLSRWFLEDDGAPVEAERADASLDAVREREAVS